MRIGDWEADTVIGQGHKEALVTLVGRVSPKTLIEQVPPKYAEAIKTPNEVYDAMYLAA